MTDLYIPVILGTARIGRQSEKAAKFILEEVIGAGLKTEILDVRDYRIEATDNTGQSPQAKKFSGKIKKADGLIIVSPEYNHGYPGELKMMLDMIYNEYGKKPVGICGVSSGPLAGARMVEKVRQVVIELKMAPIREAIYFPNVKDIFDEKGKIKIKDEAVYKERVKKFLDELVFYAETLKPAREK